LSDLIVSARLGGNYENSDENAGIPVIKMGNIERGNISLSKIYYLPEDSDYNIEDVLKNEDLLFNTRNSLDLVGKVAVWRDELPLAVYNSNLLRIEFSKEKISRNLFMNYWFNTPLGIQKLRSVATGTTSVAAIYARDLEKLSILLPTKDEQQKIAA